MNRSQSVVRFGLFAFTGLSVALAAVAVGLAYPTQGRHASAEKSGQLIIGGDDDTSANVLIQAGAAANQSLNRTDVLDGGPGNDVMFGLNGNDVMNGGPGDVFWSDGTVRHRGTNLGSRPAQIVVVEVK